jgi:hypothetical protein
MPRFDVNAQAYIELTDEQVAHLMKYVKTGARLSDLIAGEPELWWDQFQANHHIMADEVES